VTNSGESVIAGHIASGNRTPAGNLNTRNVSMAKTTNDTKTETITVKGDDIGSVRFTKSVNPLGYVEKQGTKAWIFEDGEVKRIDVEYAIQFDLSNASLEFIIEQAVKNTKTDIGNDFRKKTEKDAKDGHNATLDFFNSVLLEDNQLNIVGLKTVLPKTPESPAQRKATFQLMWSQMTPAERKEFIADNK